MILIIEMANEEASEETGTKEDWTDQVGTLNLLCKNSLQTLTD